MGHYPGFDLIRTAFEVLGVLGLWLVVILVLVWATRKIRS